MADKDIVDKLVDYLTYWFPNSAYISPGSGWPVKPPPFLEIVTTDDSSSGWGYFETHGIHSRQHFEKYLSYLNTLADEVFGPK